ncbi:MAG: hypothetical protein IPK80_34775 [Nannocystis sp.]|nr:hypothetical protein [Nannocystis sp.]
MPTPPPGARLRGGRADDAGALPDDAGVFPDEQGAYEHLAALEARLAEVDPEVLQASYEVDLGLIRWSLAMSPIERLRAATRSARVLARLRRSADEPATTERG